MAKKRLYEVAKEYNVSSEAMVNLVRELGYEVKSHMSTADEEMLAAIATKFSREKESVKQEIDRRRKLQQDLTVKTQEPLEELEKAGTQKIVSKAQVHERTLKEVLQQRKRRRDKKKKENSPRSERCRRQGGGEADDGADRSR